MFVYFSAYMLGWFHIQYAGIPLVEMESPTEPDSRGVYFNAAVIELIKKKWDGKTTAAMV